MQAQYLCIFKYIYKIVYIQQKTAVTIYIIINVRLNFKTYEHFLILFILLMMFHIETYTII